VDSLSVGIVLAFPSVEQPVFVTLQNFRNSAAQLWRRLAITVDDFAQDRLVNAN
jgi:hypothetical protein